MSKPKKVLVLRTCDSTLHSYNGFKWPKSGHVKAPDWDPEPECGRGLHGLLWGEGTGSLLSQNVKAKWLVVEVLAKDIVDLDGKVKFPEGEVVYCGNQKGATDYIMKRAPGHAVVFATVTKKANGCAVVGGFGVARTGRDGIAVVGDYGKAIAGDYGKAIAGECGTAKSGDYGFSQADGDGTAETGHWGKAVVASGGTAIVGTGGTAIAGDCGTAKAGFGGVAIVGCRGRASAGREGVLRFEYFDVEGDKNFATFHVGKDGVKPNVLYGYDCGELEEIGV